MYIYIYTYNVYQYVKHLALKVRRLCRAPRAAEFFSLPTPRNMMRHDHAASGLTALSKRLLPAERRMGLRISRGFLFTFSNNLDK